MNKTLEEAIKINWETLTDDQKDNVNRLNDENKYWYDRITELVSRERYQYYVQISRHTNSPCSDCKSKLLKPKIIKEGIEEIGFEPFENIICLKDVYYIADGVYRDMEFPIK